MSDTAPQARHYGTDGDDTIDHSRTGDIATTYDGRGGDDTIWGGKGSDTYVWRRGDGNDVVREDSYYRDTSTDTLQLEGLNPGDITLKAGGRDFQDLILTIRGTDQTLTVTRQLSYYSRGIEKIVFADGTTWDKGAIAARGIGTAFNGTDGDDTINHRYTGDIDTTYDGRGGDDTIWGGKGSDTYIWRRGDGNDVIRESYSFSDTDTLQLEGLNPDDITLKAGGRSFSDLIITIRGTDQTLTVTKQLSYYNYGIERIVFADGTTWDKGAIVLKTQNGTFFGTDGNDTINHGGSGDIDTTYYGGKGDDRIDAGGGDDTIYGGGGSDTYIWRRGDGNDVIWEYDRSGDTDTLQLEGLNPDDVTLKAGGRDFQDLIITIRGTDQTLTVTRQFSAGSRGIERIVFADGTTWDEGTIVLKTSNGTFFGTDGNDTIDHSGTGDIATTYDAGGGDDTISGGRGSDTYIWRRGDGNDVIREYRYSGTDTLQLEGLNPDDITLKAGGGTFQDMIITIRGTDQTLTVTRQFFPYAYGIERIVFADGTTWDRVSTRVIGTVNGTDGDDTIDHSRTGNIATTYDGGAGDDTISGGRGSDTYIWRRGDGNDVIWEYPYFRDYTSADTLKLEGLNPDDITLKAGGRNSSDLIITIRGTDQTLTVTKQLSYYNYGIERIVFADGTTWDKGAIVLKTQNGSFFGTDGDDTIDHRSTGDIATTYVLWDGDDRIDAGGGGDTIYGGEGSDTYIWRRGDGNDVIDDDGGSSDTDTLKLEGLNSTDITLEVGGGSFSDLIITIRGTDQTLTVTGQFSSGGRGIERIVFADGTTWDKDTIASKTLTGKFSGTDGDDTINHSRTGDIATTYDGGGGDDTISGGGGSDTYIWRRGDGNDVILEYDNSGETDTLQLEGLSPDDITLKVGGAYFRDLIITIRGTDQTLTVKGQFSAGSRGIEKIVFADGTTWDEGTIVLKTPNGIFYGTDGNDTIDHRSTGDIDTTYDGGGGDDTIKGGRGSDTYIWRRGDGNDVIWEYNRYFGTDTLQLEGLNPDDITLKAGGANFQDLILTIRGTDQTLTVRGQVSFGGRGIEKIVFADGTTWDRVTTRVIGTVNGTDGDDTIDHSRTEYIATTYDGGGGDDTIKGGRGSDTYIWRRGDGNDVIEEAYGRSSDTDILQLEGLNPDDITLKVGGRDFQDLLITIRGTDQTLTVKWQFYYGGGIERIVFADGTTWDEDTITARGLETLEGTDGDDTIRHHGNTGDIATTYDGRGGDDTIEGGKGSDTYIWRRGDGNDVVIEGYGSGDTDTLQLEGLSPDDITLEVGGKYFKDLLITIRGTDQTLTVKGQFYSGGHGIEKIVFADGTTWDKAAIAARGTVNGTNGDDTIYHGSTGYIAMTYDGGGGDDTISGGEGSDTYIWRRGDGNDVIWEWYSRTDTDILKLEGLNPADITLKAGGKYFSDLLITIRGTDQTLTVTRQFSSGSRGIERIVFADGTTWDKDTIAARALETVNGTDGDDTIDHSRTGDIATTYDGGGGDDTIEGGRGSDTYIWRWGDGNDVIKEYDYRDTRIDTLQLEGLNPVDVTLKAGGRDFQDLLITIRYTDQTLTVVRQFSSGSRGIERIVFADGTTWGKGTIAGLAIGTVYGTDGDDTIDHGSSGNVDTTYKLGDGDNRIDAGGGDDTIYGGDGADTYIWRRGDGNDVIVDYGSSGDTDTLQLEGLSPDDITLKAGGRDFQDLIITIRGTDQTLTVARQFSSGSRGIERIVFADGTTWDKAAIAARGVGTVNGTDGDDTINHGGSGDIDTTYKLGEGDDRIDAGGGDDTIYGGGGSDTYIWRRGDGNDVIHEPYSFTDTDTLQLEGLNPADITLKVGGGDFSDLIITIRGTDQTLTVRGQFSYGGRGIEQIVFADGTTWDKVSIVSKTPNGIFYGTDGNDTIDHSGTGDIDTTYDGGGGDDTISGGGGSDTYIWRRGDGNDVIRDSGNSGDTDTLQLEGLNPTDITVKAGGGTFQDLILTIRGTDQTLTVRGQFSSGGYGIEKIVFADGTTWDRGAIAAQGIGTVNGTDGNDTIYHRSTGDIATTYDGGGGDDTITGGGGSDTYIWRRGDGNDVIREDHYYGDTDTLQLEGLNPDDITLKAGGRDFQDLILTIRGTDQTLTVARQFSSGSRGIERIVFADGTTWDKGTIALKTSNGTFFGTDGNDIINHGGSGDIDTTYKLGEGDDRIDAGGGDDTIHGGLGSDTYIWRRGDGNDVVIEGYGSGDTDTLQLAGLNPDDITLTAGGRDFQDLILTIRGTDQTLTVTGQFFLWTQGIEQIVFADGTTWDKEDIEGNVVAYIGTDGDDTIAHASLSDIAATYKLGEGDDRVDAGGGDDTIHGGRGSDTYIWRRGDGNDVIREVYDFGLTDTDTLQLEGLNPTDVTLKAGGRDFQDLILTIRGTDQFLTVRKQFSDGRGIEQIVFADGTTWDRGTIAGPAIGTVHGTDGDDTIDHGGTDIIATTYDGGAGDDTISGGWGADTYIWRRGDGNDVIEEAYGRSSDTDVLQLEGLNPDDITLKAGGRNFQDLILTIRGTDQTLTVTRQFSSDSHGIEQIVFADGTTWDKEDIEGNVVAYIGTDGDDTIDHSGLSDIAATYEMGDGDDRIDAGGGDDTIYGGEGSDTYIWWNGAGNDVVIERHGEDDTDTLKLEGLDPNQVVLKSGGAHFRDLILTIRGTDQTVRVTGQFSSDSHGIERIVFADGTTWDKGAIASKTLTGTVFGTDGDDTIHHGYVGDIATTYDGGAGDDTILGGDGSDIYIWRRGDGNDVIRESRDRTDTDILQLEGLSPDDITLTAGGRNFQDLILTIRGTDQTLTLREQLSFGGRGIEQIVFADGTTWDKDTIASKALAGTVFGTDGDDTIDHRYAYDISAIYELGDGDDRINAGEGDDVLKGGDGSDTYIWHRGDGNDLIDDDGRSGDTDTLEMGDLNPDEVALRAGGTDLLDLIITIRGTDQTLTVREQFSSGGRGIERIVFADGTIWDKDAIASKTLTRKVPGTDGDDTISHGGSGDIDTTYELGEGDDRVDAGGGDDTIYGGEGSDTYIWRRGAGNDVVIEGREEDDTDVLQLAGLNPDDVVLKAGGWRFQDLIITIRGTDQFLTVKRQFSSDGRGIEQIVFADGTTWDKAAIAARGVGTVNGTDGDDTINHGNAGPIAMTYDGRGGDDTIRGGEGSDTYIWRRGDGNDVIYDGSGSSDTDVLQLAGLNPDDITAKTGGWRFQDLILTIRGTDQTLTVAGQFSSDGHGIERIVFADGTTWDKAAIAARGIGTVHGTNGDDVIDHSDAGDIAMTYDGGGGDDTIYGGEGSGTYIWRRGDGNDVIDDDGGSSDTDTLQLAGLNPADITLEVGGEKFQDLILTIRGTDQTLTVTGQFSSDGYGIERIVFADGTTWDKAAITARVMETVSGTDDDDTIDHRDTGDIDTTYDGRDGDDSIKGGDGSDVYIWRRGAGSDVIEDDDGSANTDTLQLEGLNPDDITLKVGGANFRDLILTIRGTDQTLTVTGQFSSSDRGIGQIVFADGTTWDKDAIVSKALAGKVVSGTNGNDTIDHNHTGDIATTYDAGRGDDTIYGGEGSDTYIWWRGAGNDVIREIYSAGDTDILQLAGLNPADITLEVGGAHFRDLILTIQGTDQTLTVWKQFSDGHGIERIVFADGTTWDKGTITSKTLRGKVSGTSGDDTINHRFTGDIDTTYELGAGDDTVDAGEGDDTLNGGRGSDTYIWRRGDGNDVIVDYGRFGGSDTLELEGLNPDDIALKAGGSTFQDLLLTIRGTDQVLTVTGQFSPYGIEQIVFADGTTWDRDTIVSKALAGTVSGTDGDDTIDHRFISDIATTYDGGDGDDTIYGGRGSDTYIWRRGDGNDVVREAYSAGDTDTLELEGLNPDDVTLKVGGIIFQDLILTIRGTDQTLTLTGQFSSGGRGIERIVFADGTTWDKAAIAVQAMETVNGTDDDDGIDHRATGDVDTTYELGAGSDRVDAGEGDDILKGGEGSDTYIWRRGDGNDVIVDDGGSGDTDTLDLEWLNPDDITLQVGGEKFQDLILTIRGTDQTLTITGQFAGLNGVERIVFADGTTWDEDTIASKALAGEFSGTDGSETIGHGYTGDTATTYDGRGGDDTIEGGGGSDTYIWRRGDGNDVIADDGSSRDTDTLSLEDLNPDDITLKAGGVNFQDLILTIRGTEQTLTVTGQFYSWGIERIAFADGATWDRYTIVSKALAGTFSGTDGDDTIDHRNTGDVDTIYDGGGGDDTIKGGYGSDTYIWGRGDGSDVIQESYSAGETDTLNLEDLNLDDVTVKAGGWRFQDLILTIRGTDQTLTVTRQFAGLNGIGQIVFADGTTWDRAAIAARGLEAFNGTDGNDTINHSRTGDIDTTYDGGGGDDTISGGEGSDTYIWGRGDGDDLIREHGNFGDTDTLQLEGLNPDEVTLKAVGGNLRDLMIVIDGGDQTLTIENQFQPHYGIERIVFADGTTWDKDDIEGNVTAFVGTDGDDDIAGNERDNIIDGGAGEDVLAGDEGADTFVFKTGDGHDVIEDFDDDDVIEFRGIDGLANFQDVLAKTSNDGDGNTLIAIDDENSITLEGVTLAQLQQDDFRFV